jgi:hypothetical protein
VVARSAQAAQAAAKRQWLAGGLQRHKDDLLAVDDCLAIEQLELLGGVSAGMCSWSPIPRDWASPRCPTGSATAGSEGRLDQATQRQEGR